MECFKQIDNSIVRIQNTQLNNFRNIEYGCIKFVCNTKQNIFEKSSDILGIYGQNGSGKTAFIKALSVLKIVLSGKRLTKDILNYITIGKDESKLNFEFSLINANQYYKINYEFFIKKRDIKSIYEYDELPVFISKEKLSYSTLTDGKWSKYRTLIDYDYLRNDVFLPKKAFNELTNKNKDIKNEFKMSKLYAIRQSTSFIFCNYTRMQLTKCKNNIYIGIVENLHKFGLENLYIIGNKSNGLINENQILPFIFKIKDIDQYKMGKIILKIDEPSTIPEKVFNIIQKIIKTMNTVLCEIIPGLSVDISVLGSQLMQDNEKGINIELVSNKDGIKIPLCYESDGIKKIISILHMLIFMYNNPSMTVAIDELDSGIFEYLLGEILKVINESGKGQLIFTSHNLRPLETLNNKSIIFTTTNPKNRYIRFLNINEKDNFRNLYYHDIILGGQKECIYNSTSSFSIALAFKLAGEEQYE